jgi:hypothetical protein
MIPEQSAMRAVRRYAVALGACLGVAVALCAPAVADDRCNWPLPKPSVDKAAFMKALHAFLGNLETNNPTPCFLVEGKEWEADATMRSTGPVYVDPRTGQLVSAGTHANGLVRIWYSPKLMEWLRDGRKGRVPDNAAMIKAMYPRDPNDYEKVKLGDYAIMVMDYAGSWDGWFYTYGSPQPLPAEMNAFSDSSWYDYNSFGQYCVNCHASAVDNNTFATLRNLVDPNSLHSSNEAPLEYVTAIPTMPVETLGRAGQPTLHEHGAAPASALPAREDKPRYDPDVFDHFPAVPAGYAAPKPVPFPYEGYDHVPQGPQPDGRRPFLPSSQCIGCHDATKNNDALPNMTLQVRAHGAAPDSPAERINLSPYAEWRRSMMGLSGRDPIFFAQLETERNLHPELAAVIDNKCLSCHGVMGQRTYVQENGKDALFTHDLVMADPSKASPDVARYGALARDGVSCMVCHRIEAEGLGDPSTYTGQFHVSADPKQIYGPYETVVAKPMEHSIGITPVFKDHIRKSELCSSCHTVFTPSLDIDKSYSRGEFERIAGDTSPGNHEIFHEQTTWLEWLNSVYSGRVTGSDPAARRECQDCHMPNTYAGKQLAFRIAATEDETYPFVDERLPPKEIHLRIRGRQPDKGDRYGRHALHGINLYAGAMFEQFPWLLGVGQGDPMAITRNGPIAREGALDMARNQTATVEIKALEVRSGTVWADVKVTNLAGHKLPSGVGFRRAFLEFQVLADGVPVWTSGATDGNGVIGVTENGRFQPLPTEFFIGNQYQPHHETITEQRQVQIYEEVVADSKGDITSSFLSLRTVLKENRLQPKGWSPSGPDAAITKAYAGAAQDPSYADGSGSDTVRYVAKLPAGTTGRITATATLYYQAIPPGYLNQRFRYLGQPATDRLAYFVQNLNLSSTAPDWKLRVGTAHAAAR